MAKVEIDRLQMKTRRCPVAWKCAPQEVHNAPVLASSARSLRGVTRLPPQLNEAAANQLAGSRPHGGPFGSRTDVADHERVAV